MTPRDYDSGVWRRFERCLSDRVSVLQRRLEQVGISEREADVVRGQILEIRFLLSRPEFPATANTQSPALAADDPEE